MRDTHAATNTFGDADSYPKTCSHPKTSSDAAPSPDTTRLRAWRVNIKVLKSLKLISTVTKYE